MLKFYHCIVKDWGSSVLYQKFLWFGLICFYNFRQNKIFLHNSFYLKFYDIYSAELVIEENIEYNDLVPSIQDDTSSEDKEENLPAGVNKKLASKGGILLLLPT